MSIAVIDTAGPALPSDIASYDYDSPTVINAFEDFVDELFDDLGDDPLAIPASVDLVSISIGNEVNYTLGGDAEAWTEYRTFVESAAAHIKSKGYAGVIGCKTTVTDGVFAGQLAQIKTLNELSNIDVVMLNYYPKDSGNRVLDPSVASTHLSQLVSDFASVGKGIWMMELGYQSGSTYCNSSETKQGQFFWHFFQAWDSHRNVIKTVIIDWLNDQPQWQIDQWAIDYGSSDPAFLEYLATLGLRNPNGSAKHGWTQVSAEISARGW